MKTNIDETTIRTHMTGVSEIEIKHILSLFDDITAEYNELEYQNKILTHKLDLLTKSLHAITTPLLKETHPKPTQHEAEALDLEF